LRNLAVLTTPGGPYPELIAARPCHASIGFRLAERMAGFGLSQIDQGNRGCHSAVFGRH
jgi:hypothetical protein